MLCALEITPKRFTWHTGRRATSSRVNGPSMWPREHSFCRYEPRCSRADGMLCGADLRGRVQSKLILNPSWMPPTRGGQWPCPGGNGELLSMPGHATGSCSISHLWACTGWQKSRHIKSEVYGYMELHSAGSR